MTASLRVLVVEDSEDDAVLLERELRRGGFEPITERVDTPEAMTAMLDDGDWDVVLAESRMISTACLDPSHFLVNCNSWILKWTVRSGTGCS